MLLYRVEWWYDSSNGARKVKNGNSYFVFTVLCRNISDASQCLEYHFRHVYDNPNNVLLSDGDTTFKRVKIDSRGFVADYLHMDGIRQPFNLSDLKRNVLRLNKIFSI